MGRTKLIAVLEEQHTCQWCLENLISPAIAPVPYPVLLLVPPAVISRYHREMQKKGSIRAGSWLICSSVCWLYQEKTMNPNCLLATVYDGRGRL